MNITILLGSVRSDRQSHYLAYYLEKILMDRNINVEVIDLAKTPLPIFGQEGEDRKNVNLIGAVFAKSNALIFVTPEYHGSFSGALKNALEYFSGDFIKKPISVAAASAGKMGGINASTQLQHVILSMGAYPLPKKLLVAEIQNAFDNSFIPLKEDISKLANSFIDDLIWVTEAISDKKLKEKQVTFN